MTGAELVKIYNALQPNQLMTTDFLNSSLDEQRPLLHEVLRRGDLPNAKLFAVTRKGSLWPLANQIDPATGETIMHMAARSGNESLVAWLYLEVVMPLYSKKFRVDLSARDKQGFACWEVSAPALTLALRKRLQECAKKQQNTWERERADQAFFESLSTRKRVYRTSVHGLVAQVYRTGIAGTGSDGNRSSESSGEAATKVAKLGPASSPSNY